MLKVQADAASNDELLQKAAQRMLVGRMGKPEDITGLVLYLVSDEASFLVGQVVSPNGGFNTKWV